MFIGCIALLFLSCRIYDQDSAEIVADSGLGNISSTLSLSQKVVWRSIEPAYATGGELVDINGDGQDDLLVQRVEDDYFFTYLFCRPLQTYVNEHGDI